jgi:preprotein translocase subunit YajC
MLAPRRSDGIRIGRRTLVRFRSSETDSTTAGPLSGRGVARYPGLTVPHRSGRCSSAARAPLRRTPSAGPVPGVTGHSAVGCGNGTLVNYEAPRPDQRQDAVAARADTKAAVDMDLVVFLPLLIVLGAFMFFASRRQKKAMQATIDLHESLQVGDRVHTTSGLLGTITDITDDEVDLEIAPGVVTTWMKLAVRDRIEADTDVDDYDEITDTPSAAAEVTESSATVDSTADPNRLNKD